MFIGSWKINVFLSSISFLFVFIGSLLTNTLFTSFHRGCLAFLFFYLFTYFVRWLWKLASKKSENYSNKVNIEEKECGEANKNTEEDIEKVSRYVKDLINN